MFINGLFLINPFVVTFQDRYGKKIPSEVAIMLSIEADKNTSEASSAPITLLDWYELEQEIILVMERPLFSTDLFQYVINSGSFINEQEVKVRSKD